MNTKIDIRKGSFIFTYSFLLIVQAFVFGCSEANQQHESKAIYYVDSKNGNDSNTGLSQQYAFRTLSIINTIDIKPGDRILLASGLTYNGSLQLKNIKGTEDNPVVISSYGDNTKRPIINSTGFANGVLIENCSYIEIDNLSITANGKGDSSGLNEEDKMRCGVLINITKGGKYKHVYMKSINIKDVFFEDDGFERPKGEVNTANGTQKYGYGIRVFNKKTGALLSNIKINSCSIESVGHTGVKLTSYHKDNTYGISEIDINNNNVVRSGGPGIQMSGVKDVHVYENVVNKSGSNDDTRKWGRGSGLWTWGSSDVLIEHNKFLNAHGPGDSAGAHIDFNCSNVVIQHNLSVNNAGGFCEILGNNYNCSYRYNVSINDGYRVKGVDGAFQEGKTLWFSGYCGKNSKRKGPFNTYIYNNTIYVKKDIVAKIAVDKASSGILIANNIFYIEGESKLVKGDQYKPEEGGGTSIKNVVFKNNIYLSKNNWPDDVLIQEKEPEVGDPQFRNPGGLNTEDYIPSNVLLIKNKGVKVEKLPGDAIGLKIGMDVKIDIRGNKITGLPDIGAIEL